MKNKEEFPDMNDKLATGKRLAGHIGQYRRDALLSPLCNIG